MVTVYIMRHNEEGKMMLEACTKLGQFICIMPHKEASKMTLNLGTGCMQVEFLVP